MRHNDQLKFTLPAQHPNPRVHSLLFKTNTPFKPKVVPGRPAYQRNNKHRGQDLQG
jgi:hypothetical protein